MQGRDGRLRHSRRFRGTSSGCLLPQQVARELLGIKESCHNGQVLCGRRVTLLGVARLAMVNGRFVPTNDKTEALPRLCDLISIWCPQATL